MNTINLFSLSAVSGLAVKSTLLIVGCLLGALLLSKSEPRWRVLLVRGTLVALPVLLLADVLAPVIVLNGKAEKAVPFAIEEPVEIVSVVHEGPADVDVLLETDSILTGLPAIERNEMSTGKKAVLTLLGVWFIGVFCCLCRDLLARRAIQREARIARRAISELESEWQRACDEFSITRPPLLRISQHQRSPFLIGGGESLLVIPSSLSGKAPKVQSMRAHVFRHEAAHVAGGDLRWMTVMRFCVRLLWFHPLVWALEKLHLSACEEAADAEAARRGGSREYRGALAQMALDLLPVGAPATALLRVPSIVKRLRAVGDHVSKRPPAGRASLLMLAALLLTGFVVGNFGIKSVQADGAPDYETVEAALAVKMGAIDFDGIRLSEAVDLVQIAVDSAVADGELFPLRIRLGDGIRGDTKVILKLDRSSFERVVEELARFAGGRHRVIGGEVLIEVIDEGKIEIGASAPGWVAPIDITGNAEAIEKVLRTTILPAVEFRDTTLNDALQFLRSKAEDLNRDEELPFTFVVHPEAADALDSKITLRLSNVPIGEALRYVTSLAQVKFAVTPGSVVIRPLGFDSAEHYTNVYEVPPTAFRTEAGFADAKEVLKSAGIVFGDGAAAVHKPETSRLIVKNTQAQMELVEAWIESLENATPGDGDPSDQWFRAYLAMKKGEEVESNGDYTLALNYFEQAQDVLDNVAATSPKFHPEIVRFRQNILADKIATLRKKRESKAGVGDLGDLLKRTVFPSVNFSDTTLKDALSFLKSQTGELNDDDEIPLAFVVDSEAVDALDTKITLRLTNVPLREVLRYVTSLAQVKYVIEAHAILIKPVDRPDADLYTTVFQVRPGVFKTGEGLAPVKEVLEKAGVVFGEGASVIFNPAKLQLIVRNTQSQTELVKTWLETMKNPATVDPSE